MSFEGYYMVRCHNDKPHGYTEDCYTFSYSDPCKVCGSSTTARMVDTTNGDSDGYDPHFFDGCDQQVMVWQSQLDEMRKDLHNTLKRLDTCAIMMTEKFPNEANSVDTFVYALIEKYNFK
jgi:hypothetical protein